MSYAMLQQVYVPPPEAMQFEITHPQAKVRGEQFWVVEIDPSDVGYWNWVCTCGKAYAAIRATMSPKARLIFKKQEIVVCLCVGRLVE